MKKIFFALTLLLASAVPLRIGWGHDGSGLFIGQSDDETEEKIDDLRDEIKKLEKKVSELKGREKSLQNEIESLDDQISLIQLRIREAIRNISLREKELSDLIGEIDVISGKISKLSDRLSYQLLLLSERIRSRYKEGSVSPLEYIFSEDPNGIVQKVKYIRSVEEQDKKLIDQLKLTKENYQLQKVSLEDKKNKVEAIKKRIEADKASLEVYNSSLERQKSEKNSLLAQTRGDEAVYQELLRKAKAELDAIEGAVATANFANGSKVDKGDVIAVMGNSGYPSCSTGPHLHFEVRKNSSVVNAETYLKSKTLYVNDFGSGMKKIGSGKWDWPMKDPEITQRFGKTPWSWRYAGGRHTGIDMVSDNTLIYAPDDGKMVKGSVGCYGTPMNYVAIDHGSGVISYYFHVR